MILKNVEKIIKAVVDTVESSLKPAINEISKKIDDNSDQMKEINAQLYRIEYKLDLILSSQALNKNLLVHKSKVIDS